MYFSTWLIRILVNKCYDILKSNNKIVYLNENIQKNEDSYYQTYKEESSLEWVLNKLEDDLRTVTVLYYYNDIQVSEISNILNIPEGTVKSRLSRARNKIYQILKSEEGEKIG
jgi:RNA polymerase sigma-70 factor (ECF subfamily)